MGRRHEQYSVGYALASDQIRWPDQNNIRAGLVDSSCLRARPLACKRAYATPDGRGKASFALPLFRLLILKFSLNNAGISYRLFRGQGHTVSITSAF